jgi:hypothetical protein
LDTAARFDVGDVKNPTPAHVMSHVSLRAQNQRALSQHDLAAEKDLSITWLSGVRLS